MPSASRRSQQSASWQDKLEGGRTAWSSVVHVYGQRFQARYWYDGNNLNNAREDAAEAAFLWLNSSQ
ncbi:hypothetical protein F4808DRAFT_462890 [Astrocystis sublimbata]|nr:hypothetical protein F4808DRAFT_462890 [Astrocystis sublimbata]